MNDFDVQSYLKSKQSALLLSRHLNIHGYHFYIFILKNPEYFCSFHGGGNALEATAGFTAIPRELINNQPVEIKYAFTLQNDALMKINYLDLDITEYFKIYGLYNFKNYLQKFEKLKPKKFHYQISGANSTDEVFEPKKSGNVIVEPLTSYEKMKRDEKIQFRILEFLYNRKEHQRDPKNQIETEEVIEEIFCDSKELDSASKLLLHENYINNIWWLSAKGIKYFESIIRKTDSVSDKNVFIAQSFHLEIIKFYDLLFAEAVTSTGFNPILINSEEPEGSLDQAILDAINESNFLIVDLTLERPSVYLEAGYALGKNKKVFFTAREDHNTDFPGWSSGNPKVHFDIRNYKVTWWNPENTEEALAELIDRINTWKKKNTN